MKKTIIALLALAGCTFAKEYTLTSIFENDKNYNVNSHGFYLNLSEHVKFTDVSITETLPANIVLKSFDLQFGTTDHHNGNKFQLIVLDHATSKVLGYSSTIGTVSNGVTETYEFVAADGTSPLTLSSTTTYRYLTVSEGVVDTISADTSKNYTYNAGSGAISVNGTTITGGLAKIYSRGYADSENSYEDCLYVFGANGTNTGTVNSNNIAYNVHVVPSSIKVATVPEPTTATLSLLALAGLAARRRRK